MNKTIKYSEKTLRPIIVLITFYCLIIGGIPVFKSLFTDRLVVDGCFKTEKVSESGKKLVEVRNVVKNETADRAGIQKGDIILSVNGSPVESLPDFQKTISSLADKTAVYEILRGDQILFVEVKIYRYFHFIFYIFAALGLGFLINGFFVGVSKPKEIISLIFFLFGAASSLGFFVYGGVWYYAGNSTFLMLNYSLAGIFMYPLLFHFFSVYPTYYEFRKRKLILWSVYLFSAVLFILMSGIFGDRLIFLERNVILALIINYSPFIIVLFALGLFVKSYFKIKDTQVKKSLRILLIGIIMGCAGMIYYFLLFISSADNPNLNIIYRLPIILVLSLPISFGVSIYKYKILDTEFIVKKSIVYIVATVITAAAYFVAINFLDTIYDYYQLRNKQSITIITIILVIFSFSYVTKLISSFVDKRFYKSRYNYRKSLLEFSAGLPYLNNIKEVEEKMRELLLRTMDIKYLKINIIGKKYFPNNEITNNQCIEFHEGLFRNNFQPKSPDNEEFQKVDLPETYSKLIQEKSLSIVLPVVLNDNLIGTIDIGPKNGSIQFTEEDIDLLRTLASNTAIVFENSRLREEENLKNKIEKELNVAKDIQTGLLPATEFSFGNLEISCSSSPARIIGGDFYDVIRISESKVLIVIADVSGKGLPAALYMAKVQALIRFASKVLKSPKEILIEVNRQVYEKFERKSFVTVSLGLFDLNEETVKIVRAGHNPAIFARNGKIEMIQTRGMGLGLDKDELFINNLEECTQKIEKGSIIVFYTDGLNEAMNPKNEEFGMERFITTLRNNKLLSPKKIKETIINEVNKFSDEAQQHDDITLVIVKAY